MILSYKRDMTHNYMVPESEDTIPRQDYQIQMMMENYIEGLLPCSIKRINGKGRYFYDITSRQSMESICEKDYLGEKEIRILLKGLYLTLQQVKRFLLDGNKLVLDPQLIYMDIETKEPLFAYLPSYEGDILTSFHQFTALLLQKLDQSDTEAVLLGYEIYRKSMEENYCLENLLKEAAFGGEVVSKNVIRNMAQNTTQSTPLNAQQNTPRVIQTWVEEPVVQSTPQQEHFIETMDKEKPPEKSAGKKKRSANTKKEGKPVRKKRILAITGLCVGAASGLGVAAWFWNLSVTQLGGISFLLASALGYGISAEGKRQKEKGEQLRRREEKADRRSVRKMKRMEAEQKPASLRKQEVLQKLEPDFGARVAPATLETATGPASVSPADDIHGATVLLRAGEEEYVPHLSLISMNPRERNSVVLLKESYTIGKLRNKVDIPIDDPSISRIHARIQKEGKEYFLYDLNSTNGTFVNGRRLGVNERVQIQLSDEIRFADLGYYVGKC